jgi:hypothetical protein
MVSNNVLRVIGLCCVLALVTLSANDADAWSHHAKHRALNDCCTLITLRRAPHREYKKDRIFARDFLYESVINLDPEQQGAFLH